MQDGVSALKKITLNELDEHVEKLYNNTDVSKLKKGDFCSLPVIFETSGVKLLFTETAVLDYPIMYLEKKGKRIRARGFLSPKPICQQIFI